MAETLLRFDRASLGYSRVPVVRNLSLSVAEGEVVALLGANGAGKTTTLMAASGFVRVLSGKLEVLGGRVPPLRQAHRLARRGVVQVLEGKNVFRQLTVAENLGLGARRDVERALQVFPALEQLMDRKAGLLSGGERQMLALGTALLAKPRLLLVDELSLGLAPQIYAQLVPTLRSIADTTGAGVLMVEQHADLALEHSDRAVLLAHGEVVDEGSSADLLADPSVLARSYLGEEL